MCRIKSLRESCGTSRLHCKVTKFFEVVTHSLSYVMAHELIPTGLVVFYFLDPFLCSGILPFWAIILSTTFKGHFDETRFSTCRWRR